MARPATVERRIERILADRAPPPRTGLLERLLLSGSVLILAIFAAASIPVDPLLPSPSLDRPLAPSFTPVAIDGSLLDRYAGYYRNRQTGSVMVVARDGDRLLTHRAGLPPVPEYAYSDRDFFLTTVPQQNTFVADARGRVLRVVHHQNGRDESMDRLDDDAEGARLTEAVERHFADERAAHVARAIDPALLRSYSGIYALEPGVAITVAADGDALSVRLTGRPAHSFRAYGNRQFFSTDAAAQISFALGEGSLAPALILDQGGRDRVAPRIAANPAG